MRSYLKQNNSIALGWIIFWITALFYFFDFLLRLAPAVMMDDITAQYGIDAKQFGILDASFYYAYTPLQLFAGPLLDEYGSKRIVPLAMIACVLGSLIASLELSFSMLIISRVLIGLGSGFAFIAVLKSASEWLPQDYYPFLAGLTTTLGMIGGAFAEILLPPLISSYGSVLFYLIATVLLVLLLIFGLYFIEDIEPLDEHIAQNGYESIFRDIYTAVSSPSMWYIGLIACFLFAPIQLYITWSKSFLAQSLGYGEHLSGQITSLLFWGLAIGAITIGWFSSIIDHAKFHWVLIIGSLTAFTLMFIVIMFIDRLSILSLSLCYFMIGFACASQPLTFVMIKGKFPTHLAATATGTLNMIVNLSSYLQPIIGHQLEYFSKSGKKGIYSISNWQSALSLVLILLFVSLFLSICYPYFNRYNFKEDQ